MESLLAPVSGWVALAVLLVASAASAQVPAGGAFQIGAHPSEQWSPRVSMEPDGDFVVVWLSKLQDGSGSGVFGQRFGAAGAAAGAAFQVNTGDQGDPDVSVGSRGDFVVAWSRQTNLYSESIHAR